MVGSSCSRGYSGVTLHVDWRPIVPYRVDARLTGRHPFEIYILYLAVLVSVPTILGVTPRPGTLNAVLPGWMAFGWSVFLGGGALAALIGIYLKNRGVGLIVEQFGLGLVGLMSLTYVICAVYWVGTDALFTAAIIGGFGVSCLRRYWQIQQVLHSVSLAEKWGKEVNERD